MTMLAALAVQAVRPCTEADAPTEAAVLAAEDHWVKLIEARDAAGLACLLAPEFTDTNWAGRSIPRAQVLAALPHRPNMALALSDMAVLQYGDVAIVHGLNQQKDAAGKTVGAVRFTDVFLYRERRWQAVSAQETVVRESQ
jgi:ketosteroid isomerase-like protein